MVLTTIGWAWGKSTLGWTKSDKSFYPLYFEYILGTMNGLNFQMGSNDF